MRAVKKLSEMRFTVENFWLESLSFRTFQRCVEAKDKEDHLRINSKEEKAARQHLLQIDQHS